MSKIIDAILNGNHVVAEQAIVAKLAEKTANALSDKRIQVASEIKIDKLDISEGFSVLKKKMKWLHTGPFREAWGGGETEDSSFMTHEYWDLMPEGKAPKHKREGESKYGHIIKGNWHWKKDKEKVINQVGKKTIANDEKYQAFLPRSLQSPKTGSDHLGDFDTMEQAKNAIESKLDTSKYEIR